MSATTVEYIGGIEVIKAFNQADNSYQKFTDAVHANADLILDWMKDTQKYSAVMMSVWPAALISVLPSRVPVLHEWFPVSCNLYYGNCPVVGNCRPACSRNVLYR